MLIKNSYNEVLVEQVKSLGQEIIDRAEELVSDGDLISEFVIQLRFPHDMLPTIEVTRSHLSRRYLDIINNNDIEKRGADNV